jgi:hypothetical protein
LWTAAAEAEVLLENVQLANDGDADSLKTARPR